MSQEKINPPHQKENDGGEDGRTSTRSVELLALEEYKLVQAKIDKIGDFCLKVKGWSLTITAGILAGTATSRLPWWYAFGALPTTLLFSINDEYQRGLQSVLTKRALEIERYFRVRELEGRAKATGSRQQRSIPFLANSIRENSEAEQRRELVWRPRTRTWLGLRQVRSHNWNWCVWRAEKFFYLGQYLFIIGAAFIFAHSVLVSRTEVAPAFYIGTNVVIVSNNFPPVPVSDDRERNLRMVTNEESRSSSAITNSAKISAGSDKMRGAFATTGVAVVTGGPVLSPTNGPMKLGN